MSDAFCRRKAEETETKKGKTIRCALLTAATAVLFRHLASTQSAHERVMSEPGTRKNRAANETGQKVGGRRKRGIERAAECAEMFRDVFGQLFGVEAKHSGQGTAHDNVYGPTSEHRAEESKTQRTKKRHTSQNRCR